MQTASVRHDGGDAAQTLLALVYNGELYNDAELRDELAGVGVEFRSRSDTETVLAAFATWGWSAVDRLRGMYALALLDIHRHALLLARDPLGIKPLYFAPVCREGSQSLVFASEVRSILSHPHVPRRPDMGVVSSYLTTIRTTLGERTLYDGIATLEPGQRLHVEAVAGELAFRRTSWWSDHPRAATRSARTSVREAVVDSVRRHLRSDVPVCCLLSGGLDSSIVSRVSRDLSPGPMTTFCAGADGASGGSDDFAFAREMSAALGSTHVEAHVTREMFRSRWEEMVSRLSLPLSTPNEVAINEVARRLRHDGYTVALSGEGADELFGGYDVIMSACSAHARNGVPGAWRSSGGRFQLDLAAWVPADAKDTVLSESALKSAEHDAFLLDEYARLFERCAEGLADTEEGALESHLRFQRRVNLAGLLLRLDQATMLESVEGRTPLADQNIATLAESLPLADKFAMPDAPGSPPRSKIALRAAFCGRLPPPILSRPKASFPLPFQGWLGDAAASLRSSRASREWFNPAAIAAVEQAPSEAWRFAWPMLNLAMWGEQF